MESQEDLPVETQATQEGTSVEDLPVEARRICQ